MQDFSEHLFINADNFHWRYKYNTYKRNIFYETQILFRCLSGTLFCIQHFFTTADCHYELPKRWWFTLFLISLTFSKCSWLILPSDIWGIFGWHLQSFLLNTNADREIPETLMGFFLLFFCLFTILNHKLHLLNDLVFHRHIFKFKINKKFIRISHKDTLYFSL